MDNLEYSRIQHFLQNGVVPCAEELKPRLKANFISKANNFQIGANGKLYRNALPVLEAKQKDQLWKEFHTVFSHFLPVEYQYFFYLYRIHFLADNISVTK